MPLNPVHTHTIVQTTEETTAERCFIMFHWRIPGHTAHKDRYL